MYSNKSTPYSEFRFIIMSELYGNIDGLVQDCSNSSALAMVLLQSCIKPQIQHVFHPLYSKLYSNEVYINIEL